MHVGASLLLPCQVKPGPFSDERFVRVPNEKTDWIGFVPVFYLTDQIEQGTTKLRAIVTEVQGNRFRARIPGHGLSTSYFEGSLSKVAPVGTG